MRRICVVLGVAWLVMSCSKSPIDRAVDAANEVAHQALKPLAPTDASAQAERMIRLVVADRPECEIDKSRMREVGKNSPYEATTQRGFIQVQQDACKADCCRSE